MDTAPYLPTWASSPYSRQNTWSILQPRLHELSLLNNLYIAPFSSYLELKSYRGKKNRIALKKKNSENCAFGIFLLFFHLYNNNKVCVEKLRTKTLFISLLFPSSKLVNHVFLLLLCNKPFLHLYIYVPLFVQSVEYFLYFGRDNDDGYSISIIVISWGKPPQMSQWHNPN